MSVLDRLIAEGRVTPASRDLLDIRPLRRLRGKQLSEVLQEMRDEEPW
jgi:hypothetical protein